VKYAGMMISGNLFDTRPPRSDVEQIAPGAFVLRGFASAAQSELLEAVDRIAEAAPFRQMTTPGGYQMSVAMTNCGEFGWVTDRSGYRYDPIDPTTNQPWPPLPPAFRQLAETAAERAGYPSFSPDVGLINRYEPGARLSLHQDKDERDPAAPIVSVSLGVPAKFVWGGLQRSDRTRRILLESGDVVVWGGASRFVFHGVAPLPENTHALTGRRRINLTFRRANWPTG
jgi:alkylated DNA repair protein (DNA oxidative demethylase)